MLSKHNIIPRLRYLALLLILCWISFLSIRNAKEIHENQYILTIIVSALCLGSYLMTGMLDPGVVWDSANWSDAENQYHSETDVYCSICGVYRPSSANHCLTCNVCYEEYALVLIHSVHL